MIDNHHMHVPPGGGSVIAIHNALFDILLQCGKDHIIIIGNKVFSRVHCAENVQQLKTGTNLSLEWVP